MDLAFQGTLQIRNETLYVHEHLIGMPLFLIQYFTVTGFEHLTVFHHKYMCNLVCDKVIYHISNTIKISFLKESNS